MLVAILCTAFAGQAWGETTFQRITSTGDLVVGDRYIVVSETNNVAMGTLNNSSKGQGISVSITSNTITIDESTSGVDVFTLGGSAGAYTLRGSQSLKYLGWNSSTNFQSAGSLPSGANDKKKFQWNITFSSNNASIANVADNTRLIRGYDSSKDFRAYTTSNGSVVQLYKEVVATTHTLTYSATNGSIAGVDAGSNAVASGADVAESAEVTLTATPADGFAFSSWEVSGTGATLSTTSENPTTFTMGTANATVTANFVAAGDYISASPTTTNIATAGDVAEFTLSTNLADPSYSVAYYTTSAGDETTTKPSWLGEVEISGSTLDIEVNANTGAPRTAYLKVYSGTTYSSVITINQAGKSYAISVDDDVTGGSIEADLSEAVVGATVSLTATPDAAYTFGSWTVYKNDMSTKVTVTDNKFTMPDCEVYVTANFNAKPTYAVTCVASPDTDGTLEASPTAAYAGQTVTLSYVAEDGYDLSSIVITKTSDGSATDITPAKSGDNYTFTMPGYAVTATATFESVTYEGTFALYSGELTEGDYILVYDDNALKNTVSSNKFGIESVTPSNNMISNPLRDIVWHIAPSATSGYWTIYNAKAKGYANGSTSNTNVSLVNESTANSAIWSVTGTGTYDFRCKANEGQSTARYLRYYESSDVYGNYASTNGGALTLYKLTVLASRTITFNGNGGTFAEASTYTQEVYDGVEATLDANQFTRDGYAFLAWNNQADGEGDDSYDDEDDITVSGGDLTLYAQWAPVYTLTIDDAIVGGSVAVDGDVTSAVAGAEITLTNTPSSGYGFSAWDVYKAGDTSTKVTVTDDKFTMPAYNVVISATFDEVQTYSLITDVAQLVPGKHYIIASGANGSIKAMGSQNTNYRNVVSITATNGVIPETDGVYEFVLYGPDADGYYTIYDAVYNKNAGGYLYASSSSSNYMGTQTSNNANGKWSIEIANTGAATINAQGTNTRNRMRFNSDRFSCYPSNTSVSALPYLYVKDGDTPVATTASVTLNAYGYATFASTSALDFLDADADGVDYSAWQITGVADSKITFGQIKSTVAAGKGILLKGTPGATINLNILPVGGDALSTNKLEGITTATAVENDTYYGLKGNNFVPVNAGTVPAGKALLPTSVAAGVKAFTFVFNDIVTGIQVVDNVQGTMDNAEIYNLAGQRMSKMQRGVNIVNGKKVLVK